MGDVDGEEDSTPSDTPGQTSSSGSSFRRRDTDGQQDSYSAEDDEEEEEEEEEEGEEAEAEVAEDEAEAGSRDQFFGVYNDKEVNAQLFEELHLPAGMAEEVQSTWADFLRTAESREAAGEAIYAALFDSAPSLQSLFKTPRAVMAMRFMNGLNQIISNLQEPKSLKVVVETLGFQHLDLEVTVPRVAIFRDAIVELLQVELGSRLTKKARGGWCTFLNYAGGAYIYVRVMFADRLRILSSSWATANNKREDELAMAGSTEETTAEGTEGSGSAERPNGLQDAKSQKHARKSLEGKKKKTRRSGWGFGGGESAHDAAGIDDAGMAKSEADNANSFRNTSVPTTYNEMFFFNAAVMGFGQSSWMNEVLASFDTIVTEVANSYRLQEECDVLSLRIAKHRGTINLSEYKAVMLASLRSLCPKDWNSAHEVAWSWLWENVERMLTSQMGKPVVMERALDRLWSGLDEGSRAMVRREVYSKFFTLAPGGQDYFKQSTTRLHFIADRIVSMTLEIFKDPKKMVEDISALGLRHVGYGIPTELFGPFVTACVQVVRILTDDDTAEEAFRWSLSLISRILTRVINEGSTIVMKAINTNSGKAVKKAVSCAPRGKRAMWMLNIQVGTQSISPFLWAIETGSLEAARAIISDLLTIRADRDRYYYGMDTLFERHPDVIRRLCVDAPALLSTLFDGLVWRSRTTDGGMRRVNYYVRHLVVDASGEFSKAIEWITDGKDPKIVCHPVFAMVVDVVWSRIAYRTFLISKLWLLATLAVFVAGSSALKHENVDSEVTRYFIFACRCFTYVFSLGQWVVHHARHSVSDVRSKNFEFVGPLKVPEHVSSFQGICSLLLTFCLLAMLALEPIAHCFPYRDGSFAGGGLFTEACPEAEEIRSSYGVVSAMATVFYFSLVIDLSVFSTRVSAFVLVIFRVLSEVALFLLGLSSMILTFASAVSALDHESTDFAGILPAALSMLKISLGMYSGERFLALHDEPAVLATIVVYVIVTVVFFSNLLIAQLNCSYQATYQDMVGYARLNRGKIVTEAMAHVSEKRWAAFLGTLRLDERCEFGEGDTGVSGGIQVLEPASANITTTDMIRRFGGSTSPAAQWPEEDTGGDADEDRFERMERMIEKAVKRASSGRSGKKKAGGSSAVGSNSLGGEKQSTSKSDPSVNYDDSD